MKILATILAITITVLGYSQSISNEVIAAGGESFQNNTAQIDFTIGEAVVETYSNSNNTLTQGFYQTNLVVTAVEVLEKNVKILVFPNPVVEKLTISWEAEELTTFSLQIVDLNGKIVQQQKKITNKGQVDFQQYTSGTYVVQLLKNNQVFNTYQVVKK